MFLHLLVEDETQYPKLIDRPDLDIVAIKPNGYRVHTLNVEDLDFGYRYDFKNVYGIPFLNIAEMNNFWVGNEEGLPLYPFWKDAHGDNGVWAKFCSRRPVLACSIHAVNQRIILREFSIQRVGDFSWAIFSKLVSPTANHKNLINAAMEKKHGYWRK